MILILGGVRSGKSRFAIELAKRRCKRVAYIATAPLCDKEMIERVKFHKKSRPKNWRTIEVEKELAPQLKKIPENCDGLIIECIGTYVSNLMMDGLSDPNVIKDVELALKVLKKLNKEVFIVSNEVGSGVVPETELGRRFRDIVGAVNQVIARDCDEVYLIIAGLPMKLK